MKLFRNRSLKQLALYILAGMFLILLAEYLIIRDKIEVLEEIEEKKDYARSAQLQGQQITLLVQHHINGQQNLTTEIASRLESQEHSLFILGNGGRIEGTNLFLSPLSRLPRISYQSLYENWKRYKENALSLLIKEELPENYGVADRSIPTDSLNITTDTVRTLVKPMSDEKIKALLPAQWLNLAHWYERLLKDLTDEAEEKKSSVETWVFVFIFLDLLLVAGVIYLFYRFVIQPLRKLKYDTAHHRQEFNLPANEIGQLTQEINRILEQLKDATEFVSAIGEGKLDFDYKTLDQEYIAGQNKLADSLISMQEKLKKMNEEEQRRQWANEGLTKFVDILRSSNDNINTLGDRIISALVQYTNSNQGGLYVLNDDDEQNKHLELISLFAFDTKKYEKRKIRLGEGILGQTFLEKETTLLTEIPNEYIRITSGLGEANPRSLLIVPLKVDKDVYGIVELASFRNYHAHEIAFVEKLAETIASTLASVKVAEKNKQLIDQFGSQTEQMRAQEEEMRQSMEEMQATQEEVSRKEQEYLAKIHELEKLTRNSMSHEEYEKAKESFTMKEREFQDKLREMEKKIVQKPARSDDWALAEQVEKELKIQLEALRITQDEINRKQ